MTAAGKTPGSASQAGAARPSAATRTPAEIRTPAVTRIDKWLWAARFFKTRAQASRACDIGRVECNGMRAKPAREVRAGDRLNIENEGGRFEVDILQVSALRGPAAVAQTLYRETEASHEARLKLADERKAMQQYAPLPERRPTKRERRRIIQFRRGM
jgi:ribosome-associated heat shock protein Hsp15